MWVGGYFLCVLRPCTGGSLRLLLCCTIVFTNFTGLFGTHIHESGLPEDSTTSIHECIILYFQCNIYCCRCSLLYNHVKMFHVIPSCKMHRHPEQVPHFVQCMENSGHRNYAFLVSVQQRLLYIVAYCSWFEFQAVCVSGKLACMMKYIRFLHAASSKDYS